MRGVEKLQAAVFDERHVAASELELERGAVVGGAKEHRLAFKQSARLAVREHTGRNEAGLIGVVGDGDEQRKRARRPVGPKGLGEALGRERDDGVGGRKDGAARAVVALERHHERRRIEGARKIENVAHGRGAERIDRLRVVADDRKALPLRP